MDSFNVCGGCSAKLGPEVLRAVLEKIPKSFNKNLLVGYEGSDDAAVYKLTDEIALVQTLDFFTPMVDEPYLFGKIAAANALSDVYAMGGQVLLALNIACFPEAGDMDAFSEILRGGADKVTEAGGILCGGHSISDAVKYGLSVTGIVHPDKTLRNTGAKPGDVLILTKPLGVSIVLAAHRVGMASEEAYQKAVQSMEALNRYAAEVMSRYRVRACTDVTGFGFLGHLHEMLEVDDSPSGSAPLSAVVDSCALPYISEAYDYAAEFLLTAAAQRNRNFMKDKLILGKLILRCRS